MLNYYLNFRFIVSNLKNMTNCSMSRHAFANDVVYEVFIRRIINQLNLSMNAAVHLKSTKKRKKEFFVEQLLNESTELNGADSKFYKTVRF